MIETALKIIEKAFSGKVDKAGKPYIDHLKRVASKCSTPYVKVVALLHDLLEDCPAWNETSLRCFFSDNIVDSVVVLTRRSDKTYYDYITSVLDDTWAIEVKRADLEDNMDITRLPELTKNDLDRLSKYHKAYIRIINWDKTEA